MKESLHFFFSCRKVFTRPSPILLKGRRKLCDLPTRTWGPGSASSFLPPSAILTMGYHLYEHHHCSAGHLGVISPKQTVARPFVCRSKTGRSSRDSSSSSCSISSITTSFSTPLSSSVLANLSAIVFWYAAMIPTLTQINQKVEDSTHIASGSSCSSLFQPPKTFLTGKPGKGKVAAAVGRILISNLLLSTTHCWSSSCCSLLTESLPIMPQQNHRYQLQNKTHGNIC